MLGTQTRTWSPLQTSNLQLTPPPKISSLIELLRSHQEIMEMILSSLIPAELYLLMLSSKAGLAATESSAVWRCLLLRDYPLDAVPIPRMPAQSPEILDPKGNYRRAAAAAAVYVAGGCSPELAAVPEVHRFALGPRRLSRVARLAEPRMFAAVARLGSRLYVLGGCTSLSSCLRRSAARSDPFRTRPSSLP